MFRFACGGRYLGTAAYTLCKRDTLMDYSAAHRGGAFCLVADGEADVAEKENYYSVVNSIFVIQHTTTNGQFFVFELLREEYELADPDIGQKTCYW